MWGLDSLGIPINADGSITLPLWALGVAAGLIVVLFVLALIRTGMAGTLVFLTLVGFGAWGVWSWMEHERVGGRRALEARLAGLDAVPLAPGSALACLSGLGGDPVESACERAVFASPEAAAAAVSYTTARLTLLNDGLGYAGRSDPAFELTLEPLRTALERDRFGVVAHVLAVRRNCTADRCEALNAFRDPKRIVANLKDNTFDSHVTRAAPSWSNRPLAHGGPAATEPVQARATPLPPGYSLPSASSIPPVSIMANEPPTPPQAPAAAPAANPPTPPRRPAAAKPAPQPRRQTNTASPPTQIAPSTRVQ